MENSFSEYNVCLQKRKCDCTKELKTATKSTIKFDLQQPSVEPIIKDNPEIADVIQKIIAIQNSCSQNK